jgi:hypothetical protein
MLEDQGVSVRLTGKEILQRLQVGSRGTTTREIHQRFQGVMPYGNLLVKSSTASIFSHKTSNHIVLPDLHVYHEALYRNQQKRAPGVSKSVTPSRQ